MCYLKGSLDSELEVKEIYMVLGREMGSRTRDGLATIWYQMVLGCSCVFRISNSVSLILSSSSS